MNFAKLFLMSFSSFSQDITEFTKLDHIVTEYHLITGMTLSPCNIVRCLIFYSIILPKQKRRTIMSTRNKQLKY